MENREENRLKSKGKFESSLGFTVIEIVVVIVLIGILATIAIPRFIDQTLTARQNTTNSLAAALGAASAANFAKRSANSTAGTAISNCTQIAGLLASTNNGLPNGYTITSASISPGASVTCTLTGTNSTTQTFIGLGIS